MCDPRRFPAARNVSTRLLRTTVGGMLLLSHAAVAQKPAPPTYEEPVEACGWPEPSATHRPWIRWWWHGSAVTRNELTRCLDTYRAAGVGGVEITAIYGVKGQEEHEVAYLSDAWLETVAYAINEARRREMLVDLPPGSGWRMGGPQVAQEDGAGCLVLEKATLAAGSDVQKEWPRGSLQAVVAVDAAGAVHDLTSQVNANGRLAWRTPNDNGPWTLVTAVYQLNGSRVKRPGPGGTGLSINPYSARAVRRYLSAFGKRLDALPSCGLRRRGRIWSSRE